MLNRLCAQVAAVCPLLGAAYVNGVDHTGGVRLDYDPSATAPQQTNAQAVLASFDWSQAAQDAWSADQAAKVVGLAQVKRKTAEQAIPTNVFEDVTDLQVWLAPNTHYEIHAEGAYRAAAGTTGCQLAVTGPASPAFLGLTAHIFTSPTALLAGILTAYDAPLAATASGGSTNLPWRLYGSITTGAQGGLFKIRCRSEIASSAVTLTRGSILKAAAVL